MQPILQSSRNRILYAPDIYAERQEKLCRIMLDSSVGLIFAAPKDPRYFPYQPDNNMLYLTGCEAADIAVMFLPGEASACRIYRKYPNQHEAKWDGPGLTDNTLSDITCISDIRPMTRLADDLMQLSLQKKHLYIPIAKGYPEFKKILSGYAQNFENVRDIDLLTSELRLIKDWKEQYLLRSACDIAGQAFIQCMTTSANALPEYQLATKFELHCRQQGASNLAFETIAASGKNATILHYIDSTEILHHGQLVLLDAGCVFAGYRSDISRTFPVSGKFSPEQKVLYEAVLNIQEQLINAITPGITWQNLENMASEFILKELIQLNLLKGSMESLKRYNMHRSFMFHRVGHWLGLETHDCGGISNELARNIPFKEGMIITVEPGIYITDELFENKQPFINYNELEQYRDIGIRIEDDVLITADGHKVLTHSVPKSVAAIEALMCHQN